ncbi:vomeronasal type-2 receptor 26-like [Lithobates pipiens]
MSPIHVLHHSTEYYRFYGLFSLIEASLLSIIVKIKAIVEFPLHKVLLYWIVLWMVFCIQTSYSSSSVCDLRIKNVDEEFGFYQEGDFLIGGVFTIRAGTTNLRLTKSYTKPFYSIDDDLRSILNILVFRFAIHKINQNTGILPNITLGYHITDSSLDTGVAVRNVLKILSGPQRTVPNFSCSAKSKLVGFIGDHYSVTTFPMAQILGVYGYTQISYGATDYSLTDRALYPHVFRTVQNNHAYLSAIVKLMKHFGWTWVGIFTTKDDAGEKETYTLTKYMNSNGICVEYNILFGLGTVNEDKSVEKIVQENIAIIQNLLRKSS